MLFLCIRTYCGSKTNRHRVEPVKKTQMYKRIIDETTPLRIGSDLAELFPKILAVANPVLVKPCAPDCTPLRSPLKRYDKSMATQDHWQRIYQTKSPQETSWYQPHLQTSLDWISEAVPDRSASIIDVGGGEATLVDDLLARQYRSLTVVDVAEAAIRKSQNRLGPAAKSIHWIVGNLTEVSLPPRAYDLWHDRAVFHFFTESEQRMAYVRQLASSLKIGGHALIATFGPQGPEKCSGLVTRRYDAESLLRELGQDFRLVRDAVVEHQTPFGTTQQFLYCHLRLCCRH